MYKVEEERKKETWKTTVCGLCVNAKKGGLVWRRSAHSSNNYHDCTPENLIKPVSVCAFECVS